MGIKDLLKLFQSVTNDRNSQSQTPVSNILNGKLVALDAFVVLHFLIPRYAENLFFSKHRDFSDQFRLNNPDLSFDFAPFIKPMDWTPCANEFVRSMRQIHSWCKGLIVVFDGKRSDRKIVDQARDQKRSVAIDNILKSLACNQTPNAVDFTSAISIPRDLVDECIRSLRLFRSIPVVAYEDEEADHQQVFGLPT